MPVSIHDGFESAAEQVRQGIRVNWRRDLVVLEMIDIEASDRDNIVCVQPESERQREHLAYKTLLLQNYAGIDPVVDEVLRQMHHVLGLHEVDGLIDELLLSTGGKLARDGLVTWLDTETLDLCVTPRTTLALQGRSGFESVKLKLEDHLINPPVRKHIFAKRAV